MRRRSAACLPPLRHFAGACDGGRRLGRADLHYHERFSAKRGQGAHPCAGFSMYRFYTGIVECPCVTMEKNADFTIDPQRVIDTARREGARLIVFSNPCNPTSVGLSADDARKIIRGTDALVVLDEAYMDFGINPCCGRRRSMTISSSCAPAQRRSASRASGWALPWRMKCSRA